MSLRDIKEVKNVTVNSQKGTDEVNSHLKDGWILIDISKPDPYTIIFHMGRVKGAQDPTELKMERLNDKLLDAKMIIEAILSEDKLRRRIPGTVRPNLTKPGDQIPT